MYEVNRSVLILVPQSPFWHWLNQLPAIDLDGLTLEDLQTDANAYLIDPVDDLDEAWDWVATQVDSVFSAELADWCEDETLWPDLHPDIFFEWFDVQVSSIVTDLSQQALARENFTPLHLPNKDS